VGSSVFWIFVVIIIMLLNTKSLLIATKQSYFVVLKSINNLLHQMFFWLVYVYNYLNKSNLVSVSLNASLKDDDDIQKQVK